MNGGEWDAGLEQMQAYLDAYDGSEEGKSGRVESLSARTHTPVLIIRTEEEAAALPTRREHRAKGWYDTEKGEVVIVLPNNVNVADVDNTFVHEVIGHKGLRALVGEERFGELLDKVYGHAGAKIRSEIDRRTASMVYAEADRLRMSRTRAREAAGEDANAHYYADMASARTQAERRREPSRREATEEYMADLAGRIGSEGFEKMERDELTLWGKIKAVVQRMLDLFLRTLNISSGKRLNDKELAYILFRSWKYSREGERGGDIYSKAEDAVMRHRTGWDNAEFAGMSESAGEAAARKATADRIEDLFESAVRGELSGKPVEVGRLTAEGKEYLERLSGVQFKDDVRFVLNPSDLVHMYRNHYGANEKDPGNNLPLNNEDIRAIAEVVSHPERVVLGKEPDGLKRNMFYFLSPATDGTYNLLEIYGDRKGNLTTKTFYKTRKAVSQRVLSLLKSEHLTSVTDGASLSDGAKLPKFFEYTTNEGDGGLRYRDGDMGLEEYVTKMKVDIAAANADNLEAKREAMRAIGGNLNHLRQAMARQREYDVTTVKSITDLARTMMQAGLLDDMSQFETRRILGAVDNATGKDDTGKQVQKMMDILVDNQLRRSANEFGRLLRVRAGKVDSRGVQVQGVLDVSGQVMVRAVKEGKALSKETLEQDRT